jgi:single-strand DNA-binding protein
MGHLGQDPDMKRTGSGKAVCNFSVATTERWKDRTSGEQKEKTEWHRVVCWEKTAEWVGEHLKKGDLVFLRAPIRTRKWEDKDGVTRYTTEIVCTRYEHLIGLPKEQRSSEGKPAAAPEQGEAFDDDIPF